MKQRKVYCDLFTLPGMMWIILMVFFGCGGAVADQKAIDSVIRDMVTMEDIAGRIGKLEQVRIAPDYSDLSANDRQVIQYLVEASKIIDNIFLQQVSADNQRMLDELSQYIGTANQVYYDYFKIMFGPWDRLNNNEPFINLDEQKPLGADYYPSDLTKAEFNAWIDGHPDVEEDFTSPFTLIERNGQTLEAVPYSEAYEDELNQAAGLLKKAAGLTSDATLAAYLESRAAALLTNDYRQSDTEWIALNGDIEFVFGPYETYEDELLGFKAAFESFVCVVDRLESEKLDAIESFRQELVDNYPLPEGLEVTPKGLSSPIKVVNELFSSGDARSGIPSIAFNLPNDEWVRENVGSKNVMLKNIMEAKYNGILVPIKNRLLAPGYRDKPSFDGFFNFVLMHELSHGLGPGSITVNGEESTVKAELKELYSTIEECQADTLSIYNNQYLIETDNSPMPTDLEDALYGSYLAGMFRSIRFGFGSAHGGAVTIQLNWHIENGGFFVDSDGLFALDAEKLKASVKSLAQELLVIELTGDYSGAKELIDTYQFLSPEVQNALDKIDDVPIDVRKTYQFDE